MKFILFFGANFIRLYTFLLYLTIFPKNCRLKKKNYWFTLLIFSLFLALINVQNNPYLNIIANLSTLILLSLNYNFTISSRGLVLVTFIAFNLLIESLGSLIVTEIMSRVNKLLNNYIHFFIMYSAEIIKLFIIIMLKFYKKQTKMQLPKRILLFLASILSLSIIIYFAIISISWKSPNYELIVASFSIMLCVGIINILVLYVLDEMNTIQNQITLDKLIISDLKAKKEYYASQENYIKETNRFRHDIKNKLLTLRHAINDNIHGQNLLAQLIGELTGPEIVPYCANAALNAVLTSKFERANANDIHIKYDFLIPNDLKLDYGEIGVLFGNLLDNAIEACQNVKEDNKKIEIICHYQDENLILSMKNPMVHNAVSNLLYTSKPNKELHGFGLKSAEAVVKRHDGHISYGTLDNTFEVFAILYGV